ncbi:DNA repair-scaffolding protein isoform X2 [Aplysia californica]|uniref:DNA repair-scaffolding protein isoform X2 n=1 Tax=Aplysia californica TaxID=6500 RepID=A0ABM1VR51_APLCA|nr:DNA repair-scaffolding protein isoform X2 [Aplysia californica]
MPGWQHVGSGFSGMKKFQRLGAIQRELSKSGEASVDIKTDKTPEKSKWKRIVEKIHGRSRRAEADDSNAKKTTHGSGSWKQENLLSAFSRTHDNTPDRLTQESEAISWSDSSSEEETACVRDAASANSHKRRFSDALSKVGSHEQTNSEHSGKASKDSLAPNVSSHTDNQILLKMCSHGSKGPCFPFHKKSKQQSSSNCPSHLVVPQKELSSSEDVDIISQSSKTSEDTNVTQEQLSVSQRQESVTTIKNVSEKRHPNSVSHKGGATKLHSNTKVELSSRVESNFAKRPRLVARKLYTRHAEPIDGGISDIESEAEANDSEDEDGQSVVSERSEASDVAAALQTLAGSLSSSQQIDSGSSPACSGNQSLEPGTSTQYQIRPRTPPDMTCALISPPTSPVTEGIRASEWVMAAYKHRTPDKDSEQTDQTGQDSAKKKSKFVKGSLSGQLSRLINREKSAVRFWYHSLKAGTVDQNNPKAITVKLLSMKRQFSTFVCQSKVVNEAQDKPEVCKVVFLSNTVEKLGLKGEGSVVQIFPPWQQLEDSLGVRTLLCTQYVRVLSHAETSQAAVDKELNKGSVTFRAVWKCPCAEGSGQIIAKCPAALDPAVPGENPLWGQVRREFSFRRHGPSQHMRSHLVNTSSVQTLTTTTPGRSVDSGTLLDSLEKVVDGDSMLLPHFSATVLRVFEHCGARAGCHRYEVLLEDSMGTLALIRDVDEGLTQAGVPLTHLEESLCSCEGLTVSGCIDEDREPALFSVVAQAWRQNGRNLRDPNRQKMASQVSSRCPRFCHVLKCQAGNRLDLKVVNANEGLSSVKDGSGRGCLMLSPMLTEEDVFQADVPARVSFLAHVVCPRRSLSQQDNQAPNVYVLLLSGSGSAVFSSHRLEVTVDCHGGGQELVKSGPPELFFFRDVLNNTGKLKCDQYTLALKRSLWESWGLNSRLTGQLLTYVETPHVKLAPVTAGSVCGSLTSVQGTVSDVEKSSACVWDLCNICGGDQLYNQQNCDSLWCSVCQQSVLCPVVRMKMVVHVQNADLPHNTVVRVNLLQKSIESLLPQDRSQEGYDVKQVSGRNISLPVCLVQHNEWTSHGVGGSETQKDAEMLSHNKDDQNGSRLICLLEMEWG